MADPNDPLVEKVARELCEAKGHSPDTLYEHHEWEEWPVDERREYVGLGGEKHVNLMHYAWRRYEKAARAIIPIVRDADRWLPIESAPKDGTRIDLWMVNQNGEGWREADAYWVTDYNDARTIFKSDGSCRREYYERDGWCAPNHDYDGGDGLCDVPRYFNEHPNQRRWIFTEATHWQPTPLPPKDKP